MKPKSKPEQLLLFDEEELKPKVKRPAKVSVGEKGEKQGDGADRRILRAINGSETNRIKYTTMADERVTPSGFRQYKMIRSDEDTNNYTLVFLIEISKDTLFHVGIDDIIENIMHAMNYNAVRMITLDDVRDFFDGFSNVPDKTWQTYEKKHIGRFRLEWVHDNPRGSFFVKLTRQANPLTMKRNTNEGLEGMI